MRIPAIALPAVSLVALALAGAPALAQQTAGRVIGNAALMQLLNDGYEIKAGFAEAGVPYIILQKGTSAYMCRGGVASSCEKLN